MPWVVDCTGTPGSLGVSSHYNSGCSAAGDAGIGSAGTS